MSLNINNRATPKQEVLLTDLGYIKSTTNWPLTRDQAAEIITELIEQQKVDKQHEQDSYGSPGYYPEDDDPFNNDNKYR